MKIKQEHFNELKIKLDTLFQNLKNKKMYTRIIETYEKGEFFNASKVKDLQKRFCWDCLYALPDSMYLINEIYKYANDDHIFTALKKICPKVEKKYYVCS